jgi:hypothetical protein
MTITSTEAAQALSDIERTRRRTQVSGAYHVASPHFILWGLVWAAGYTGCGLVPPEKWSMIWLPWILIGVVGAITLRIRGGRSSRAGAPAIPLGMSMTIALALGLFMGAVYLVFQPATYLPYLVFPALLTALLYALIGALAGLPRYTAVGAAIFLVTMAGFLYAKPWLPFWIAAAGGGGLVLAGLWMRRV